MQDWNDALGRVLSEVIGPDADRVDAEGAFPAPGITALSEAGLLGLTVSGDVGGEAAIWPPPARS